MSNYTIAVAWSGKDALSDSNPAKVISGSDFNTEFTAVQTAVNTKADLNGSASESFTANNLTAFGTTTLAAATATTPTPGDNDTSVATTAYVQTELGSLLGSLGTNADGDRTVSVLPPSGGSDGDIWYRY